jgi:predicted nuclease of predicted toxin-antitoxin system
MTFWIDAQLSPWLAVWLREQGIDAVSIRSLGLHTADDGVIFRAAQKSGIVIMTKDVDFVTLVKQFGIPPQILWVTVGNVSNVHMKELLLATLPILQAQFRAGEPLIEIRERLSFN